MIISKFYRMKSVVGNRLLAACFLGVIGFFFAAKPTFYLIRQQWLTHQAKGLWSDFKESKSDRESGKPVAWIKAPQADLESLVLWDVSEENLRKFPAWSQWSSAPNGPGLGMVFGHRDAHFRKLDKLEIDHRVQIEGLQSEKDYRVAHIEIIERDKLPTALADEAALEQGLVLVTCYPFRYAGPAPQRFLAWLEPVESSWVDLADKERDVYSEKCLNALPTN